MAKKIFEIKLECLQANKNKTGSNVMLTGAIEKTEAGAGTRTAVNIVVPNAEVAGKFDPGKKYTVTVSEE